MNPMVRKEFTQRMRERRGWVLPTLYLVVLAAVVLMAYFFSTNNEYRSLQGAELGVIIFVTVTFAQLTLLLLLAPIFSAAAITIEKEQKTYASLLTTLLSPLDIWIGKFASAAMFLVLLVFAGLPILSMVFAFGGVGYREILLSTITTLLVMASTISVGLYFSSYFRRSVHATAVSYIVVVALSVVTMVAFLILTEVYREPSYRDFDELPWKVRFPLYMNPYFLQTLSFSPQTKAFDHWMYSAAFFIAVGVAATLAGLRNLSRPDEQV
jgi:ABC-type transport system involved in multi-copper enzyme maturation permease subunit